MRIVHLLIGGDVAGGQMVALQLMHAAQSRGDRVTAISPGPGPFIDLLRQQEIEVELIDLSRTFHVREALRLRRLLRRDRALLHIHTQLSGNILGRLAARLAGSPVVSHMHSAPYFRPVRAIAAVHRTLDNLTARLCARIIAVSDATRDAYVRQGYPAERTVVVHNGIAERSPQNVDSRSGLGVPPEVPLVGSVGRLCAFKGQRELIEAVSRLGEDVHVVLVGKDIEQGGAYEQLLRDEAERLGVADRIVFAGYRDDVDKLLRSLDVLVLPSWTEGFPVVLLEAMAAGVPVVATSVGGIPELVADGETGILVEPRDVDGLTRALNDLLARPDRGRELGRAGAERVRAKFSEAEMTGRVLEIYDEIAAAQ
jgi:glycosyltransferase involved in cell wall biosynthesis